ncbi:hypothetical protein BDB00DRAFT_879956 [Zychaea mexicana]|uniref:uncharacterized protein n=1 Tax=Zychaea mexicana TaxID=64656 RepID=UPI0022FEFD5A|nr:uncharacterized protein BDB00DRAFT_879956 [Zychaea mexicana]KAI9471428.1 hypothetical protein BDB00DRAFT_879956 [Zychaea mexicana]
MLPAPVLFKKIPALSALDLQPLFPKLTFLLVKRNAFNVKAIPAKSPQGSGGYTATVITGKKAISKLAVIRCRAARRLKAAIADRFPHQAQKDYHYIFYAFSPVVTMPWSALKTELSGALDEMQKKTKKSASRPVTRKQRIKKDVTTTTAQKSS